MAWDGLERRNSGRRNTDDNRAERRFRAIEDRLYTLEESMSKVERFIGERAPQIIDALDMLTAAKGGFTVLTWVGKGAKPILMLVLVAGALTTGVKTGFWKWPF